MQLPITPYKVKKGFLYWKHFGTREFLNHLMDRMEPEQVPYGPWFAQHKANEDELKRQRNHPIRDAAKISVIVPAYHTPERFLTAMIESVIAQTYDNWELVIADAGDGEGDVPFQEDDFDDYPYEDGDYAGEVSGNPGTSDGKDEAAKKKRRKSRSVREVVTSYTEKDRRIRYIPLEKNYGIAENTNLAMKKAQGEYVAFLDHDDLIAPDALYEAALEIRAGADFIYTDEDKITSDGTRHFQPHLKPEFNLDLLRSNNYITHFLVVRKALAEEAGGFDEGMSGAQDYDFIFRTVERAEKIVRIPKILYHWRTHKSSTADNPMSKSYAYDAGKRAIENHLKRVGQEGTVEQLKDFGFYRVKYPVKGEPLVSVIIPNKDQAEALMSCVSALWDTDYPNLEIIIVENGSKERSTFETYRKLSQNNGVRLTRWKNEFNYSAINNFGVGFARGDYLLFLNNDVRGSISTDWLTEMLGVCQREDVGAVGARLYYPDNRIQSAGIVVGMGGVAGSLFVNLPRGRSGYLHKSAIMQDLSAVTAACMMVKREAFVKAGGFTEELAVAFNDVDLCLKIGELGYRIVYDPFAELYHDESRSRGPEDTPEKVRRFQEEIEYFRTHYLELLKEGDPCYNPNLSLKKWNYSLKV